MKLYVILALCLFATAVFAKKDRDSSKRKSRGERTKRIDREQQDDALLNVKEEGADDDDDDEYDTVEVKRKIEHETSTNPCNNVECKRGEGCVLDEGEPLCVCEPACQDEPDERFRVCSTRNVTYQTECHLDRDHCLCNNRQPGCSDANYKKVRLDYYAICKELSKCPKEEFDQFSERMRDWLYIVMRDLANQRDEYHEELDEYLQMLESAGRDDRHADAVMWKFCDLDIHPSDRKVSKRELMYINASIKPMEHCLVPFLSTCDSNDDNKIDMQEWGTCLGIEQKDITDKCDLIKAKRG